MIEQEPIRPNVSANTEWERAAHEIAWIGSGEIDAPTPQEPTATFGVICRHCLYETRFPIGLHARTPICIGCGQQLGDQYNDARAGEMQRPGTPATPPLPPPPPQPQVEPLLDLNMRSIPNDVRDALVRIERWANRMTAGHWVLGGIEKRRPVTSHPTYFDTIREQLQSRPIDRPMPPDRMYWTVIGVPPPMVTQPSEPEVGPDHERPF